MSADRELPPPPIAAETVLQALSAGALDECLVYLRHAGQDGDPVWNCRLAEAMLRAGRRDEALECVRRAFPLLGDGVAPLRICAWVFSNCGCHREAAYAFGRLLELCPEWVDGHRHLSGALAAAGQQDAAIRHAKTASELAPDNGEYAAHAASLLIAAGALDEAAGFLDRAVSLASGDAHLTTDTAELLMQCGRVAEAAELLDDAAAAADDPRLLRVLSTAEMLRDRVGASLAAIERAIVAAPDNAEYRMHLGHLLWRLGDIEGAARAFDRAAALDPTGREVRRARMTLYLAAGLTTEATAAGGELLLRFPDDTASAEAVLHLLNHRLATIDGEYVVLADGADRGARPRRAAPGALERMRSQWRVIHALMIRETRTRFAEFRLGYGWALLEPILHIALLSATFAILMHGRPPIGTHFFIFYYTGLIRY